MTRRVTPFQGSCHGADVEYVCISCTRIACGQCEPSPGEPEWCDQCWAGGCRMTNHPADPRTAPWRCGSSSDAITLGGLDIPAETCTLPAGHDGWHRADSGNQWKATT